MKLGSSLESLSLAEYLNLLHLLTDVLKGEKLNFAGPWPTMYI